MGEDKKKYTVIGKVEIGTDEYRDLIEDKFNAENDKDYYMREGWKKDSELSKIREENKKLKIELDELKAYIKKQHVDITEDSITLFAKLFGEE